MIPTFLSIFFYSDPQILLAPDVNGKTADLLLMHRFIRYREKNSQRLLGTNEHTEIIPLHFVFDAETQGSVWPSQGHSRKGHRCFIQ